MTSQAYPIIAVIKYQPVIVATSRQDRPCLTGLVISGRPSLGLAISEHLIVV